MSPPLLCACGCGTEVTPTKRTPNRRFLHHHNARLVAEQNYRKAITIPGSSAALTSLSEEQELMMAQLHDARQHKFRCKDSRCQQCAADFIWAMSTAAWGLYAFHTICEYLNLDQTATQRWFFATAR